MNFFTIILLLYGCLVAIQQTSANNHEENKPLKRKFYQNLTDPINEIISKNDNLNVSSEKLKKYLEWSPLVLYCTDLPLDNVTDTLVQVITLLNQFCPEHQVILSLQFTKNNEFIRRRIEDLYYELSPNISVHTNNLIISHLSAVILDWRVDYVDSCERDLQSRNFYTMSNFQFSSLVTHSFPKYVYNFLKLHFQNTFIPVGVMYSTVQVECHKFLQRQIQDADFLVLAIRFWSPNQLTLSPEKFQEDLIKTIIKNGRFSGKNNVTILMDFGKSQGQRYELNDINRLRNRYPRSIIEVMPSLVYYEDLTTNFSSKLNNEKYLNFFTKLVMNWTMESGTDIIFDGISDQLCEQNDFAIDKQLVIPFIKATEESDICHLKTTIKQKVDGVKNVAVNLDSWRAIARFENELEGGHCSQTQTANYSIPNKVETTLYFDEGTGKIWNIIEHRVRRLLKNFATVNRMKLNMLLFYADDLKEDNNTISNFLRSGFVSSGAFKIGCVISFEELLGLRWESHRRNLNKAMEEMRANSSVVFKSIVSKMCQPVFDQVGVIVWKLNDFQDGNYKNNFPTYYHNVFITREVFMKEFPDKDVIIETTASNLVAIALSEIFGVSVILKS